MVLSFKYANELVCAAELSSNLFCICLSSLHINVKMERPCKLSMGQYYVGGAAEQIYLVDINDRFCAAEMRP